MLNQPQIDLFRFQLRRKESKAKAVPYISFIFTHAALVLFLLLSFFSDRLFGSTVDSLAIKISLAVLAVVLIACEWIYAITTSRRWRKDIALLLQLEEEQRHREEQAKLKKQEEIIAAEQLKNRMLQADLQRQRDQMSPRRQQSYNIKSPQQRSSGPTSAFLGNSRQYSFPPLNTGPTEHSPYQ